MKNKLRIGTRGSKLALWQAEEVQRMINELCPLIETEIVVIKTKGDKILDVSLSKIGDKGLFTKEIEKSLIAGEIDMAVHSLKDMPTELPAGLVLGAILPREDVRDILVSRDGKKLADLTASDKIGTSSLRRKAQLLAHNPSLNIVDIRGNVDTRLERMNAGMCDAMIMAGAGFIRLGYQNLITEFISPEIVLPAVSQGAVAIEIREGNDSILACMDAINNEKAWVSCMAERSLLRTLEGGCQIPVGCMTEWRGEEIDIWALVSSLDGKTVIKEKIISTIDEASEKAIELGNIILEKGGSEILNSIRKP